MNKEIIFGTSDSVESRRINKMEKEGKLKKIAPRIYTSNLLDSESNIIRRNFLEIIAWRLPNAIISHRSSFSMSPTPSGDFFLTAGSSRIIDDIPGIKLNVMKGADPLPSDIKLGEMPLYVSSEYRRTLEVLQSSRKRGDESKSLEQSFVEKRMESLINSQGERMLSIAFEMMQGTFQRSVAWKRNFPNWIKSSQLFCQLAQPLY